MTTEYGSPTELAEAFVNDNITEGRTIYNNFNLEVVGNALYVYIKKSGGAKETHINPTEYIQTAIRIPDNVFILNKFTSGEHTLINLIESTIVRSLKGKYIHLRLTRVRTLTENGTVRPDVLREAINNLTQPGAYPIRNALKTFGKERMQEAAIANFNHLRINLNSLRNPEQHGIDSATKAIIKDSIRRLQHAKKVCRMVDKYLDILTQFPELEP